MEKHFRIGDLVQVITAEGHKPVVEVGMIVKEVDGHAQGGFDPCGKEVWARFVMVMVEEGAMTLFRAYETSDLRKVE